MKEIKNYHAHIDIKKALDLLAKGENLLAPATPLEAFHSLIDALNSGKTFFTGCNHTDYEGRCRGHLKRKEETTEESDQYDRDTIHQS